MTGKEGYLATINSSGNAVLTGANAQALFVVDDEGTGTSGDNVTLAPLTPDQSVRLVSAAIIACAQEITSNSGGAAVGASSGSWVVGIAEEAAVSGQLVLTRPSIYKKA